MKYFKLTYYLLFICIATASCSADDSIVPDLGSEAVRVQLTIQFPETATRLTPNPGTTNEQNIDNLHLYVFEANNDDNTSFILKEEAKGISFSDEIEGKRTVTGVLFEKYSKPIKLVALANLDSKGLEFSNLPGRGTKLSTFYEKLIYTRSNDEKQWPLNKDDKLPMSGECMMEAPTTGIYKADLSLIRAVAKISVRVRNGQELENNKNFKMTKIEVLQYNNRGYCTSPNTDQPNALLSVTENSLTYVLQEGEEYHCKDRIYIPEQCNINASDNQKVFLRLTAVINEAGDTQTFIIHFKKNGTGDDFNVLRNNMYVFNIESVTIGTAVEQQQAPSPSIKTKAMKQKSEYPNIQGVWETDESH